MKNTQFFNIVGLISYFIAHAASNDFRLKIKEKCKANFF